MKIDFYLLIESSGGIELRKTLPRQQHMDCIAVRLSVTLSDAWFRRPIPLVEIAVSNEHILLAPVITTELAEEEASK